MPLTINPSERATKITQIISDIVDTYQTICAKSEKELAQQKLHKESMLESLMSYDLSSCIDNIRADEKNKPNGYKALGQMVFCEIITFDYDDTNQNLKTVSTQLVFLKSQMSEILDIIKPPAINHELIYVLSELKTMQYDIHDTGNIENVCTNFEYCAFELEYEIKITEKIMTCAKTIMQYIDIINTPIAINELSDYNFKLSNMPVTIKILRNKYPEIPDEVHETIASYIHVISQNINNNY